MPKTINWNQTQKFSAFLDSADGSVSLYALESCAGLISQGDESGQLQPTGIYKCMLDCGRMYKSYHTSKKNKSIIGSFRGMKNQTWQKQVEFSI